MTGDARRAGSLKKPLGIAHASSGVGVVNAAAGSTTNFTPADVASVYKALPAAYRPGATWLLHPDVFADKATRTDTAGGLVSAGSSSHPEQEPAVATRQASRARSGSSDAASVRQERRHRRLRGRYTVRIVRGIGAQRLDELDSDNGRPAAAACSAQTAAS